MPAPTVTEPARLRAEDVLHFGRFTLVRSQRLLLEDGLPMRIGGRAFDVLLALAERPGETVSRRYLVSHVWPHTVVEDTALRASIAAVRRVLKDDGGPNRFIDSVAGQGYSFVAPVRCGQRVAASSRDATIGHPAPLPSRLDRLVGREDSLAVLSKAVDERRLLTLVGMGGVGKTALALEAAELFASAYRDGVCYVDLAIVPPGGAVLPSVVAALGLPIASEGALIEMMAWLSGRQVLVLLDSCEHVIDAVAEVVHQVMVHTESVRILATSQEPLRVPGEWVHRLAPLQWPMDSELTPDEAVRYPAVELFVERATGSDDRFALTAANVAGVAEICRRCDGLPLAIELAASRFTFFGVQGVLAQLDDRLSTMQAAHRTAPLRHRSLLALLDWSYALLPLDEQKILRRVSVFGGPFPLQAAIAIAASETFDPAQAMLKLWALCSKSLVISAGGEEQPGFELLETVRAYGRAQLAQHGETDASMARLAGFLLEQIESVVTLPAFDTRSHSARLRYGGMLSEAWRTVDWALTQPGREPLGVALTLATVPLGDAGLTMQQHAARLERAMGHLAAVAPAQRPAQEARLLSARHAMRTQLGVRETRVEGTRLHHLVLQQQAEGIGLDAQFGLWASAFGRGDYREALERTEQLAVAMMSTQGAASELTITRMLAQCHHFLGDHRKARALAEHVLDQLSGEGTLPMFGLQPVDMRVSMRILLARIAWLEGRGDDALRIAHEAQDMAAGQKAQDRCQALALATCPIAWWAGNDVLASYSAQTLMQEAKISGLLYWTRWGLAYSDLSQEQHIEPLSTSASISNQGPDAKLNDMRATLGDLSAAAEAVTRVQAGLVGWCGPEAMRLQAGPLWQSGDAGQRLAGHAMLEVAWSLAERQGALAWSLRIACDQVLCAAALAAPDDMARQRLHMLTNRIGAHTGGRDLERARALLDAKRPATPAE